MKINKAVKLAALLSVLIGYLSFHFYNQRVDSVELTSTQGEVKRKTEIGKAVVQERKNKNESQVILNDPAMQKKWGLKHTQAKDAWKITRGDKDIVVAVIDTGIDVNHPDIKKNLWTNRGEQGVDKNGNNKATNGIDDDNNGFVDDVYGWNFVANNNDLSDNHGHGTHIAGIVGAEGGNNIGISGVAPQVSLMILKYYDPTSQGNDNLKNTIKAIEYAVKMNAHIINYSGGGLEPSAQELAAIKKARDKGILFVAAAGNESSNSDDQKYYPADYELDNIISVTAIDKNSNVLSSSNYGVNTVDVAAPGNDIYSTLPGGQYGVMTGTSQATAFVTGVGALLMGHNKEFRKADRVIKYLLKTGDYNEGLTSKTRHKRLLNVYRALTILDQGTSLNGVMAENTNQSFNISSDSDVKITDERSPSNMAAFAKELSDLINKEKKLSDSNNNRQPVNY